MRLAGHVAMYGTEKRCIKGCGGEAWGEDPTWKTSICGRIIFKWIFKKWEWGHRLD
jgi:hypothetical protein